MLRLWSALNSCADLFCRKRFHSQGPTNSPASAVVLQQLFNVSLQDRAVNGLAMVSVKSESQSFLAVASHCESRQCHHAQVSKFRILPEPSEYLVTIQQRHLYIKQNRVRTSFAGRLQCSFPVDSFNNFIAP